MTGFSNPAHLIGITCLTRCSCEKRQSNSVIKLEGHNYPTTEIQINDAGRQSTGAGSACGQPALANLTLEMEGAVRSMRRVKLDGVDPRRSHIDGRRIFDVAEKGLIGCEVKRGNVDNVRRAVRAVSMKVGCTVNASQIRLVNTKTSPSLQAPLELCGGANSLDEKGTIFGKVPETGADAEDLESLFAHELAPGPIRRRQRLASPVTQCSVVVETEVVGFAGGSVMTVPPFASAEKLKDPA